jgi:SAM-dependent methyltransferase
VSVAGRALVAWDALWQRLEGPEMDARLCHSHYLNYRLMAPEMARLGALLRGVVLDVGAGTGYARRFLDPAATRYLPTDLPGGRDADDPRIAADGVPPRVLCSGYALPFADASVDGVAALMVLEHTTHPEQILAEAHRVLRPGGRVLVSVPFAFPVHGAPQDFRRWTAHGLAAELERAGFRTVELSRIGNGFATLALNLEFLVRFHLAAGHGRRLPATVAALAPLRLAAQAALNGLAMLLGPLDRSGAFPLAVAAVAEKAAPSSFPERESE